MEKLHMNVVIAESWNIQNVKYTWPMGLERSQQLTKPFVPTWFSLSCRLCARYFSDNFPMSLPVFIFLWRMTDDLLPLYLPMSLWWMNKSPLQIVQEKGSKAALHTCAHTDPLPIHGQGLIMLGAVQTEQDYNGVVCICSLSLEKFLLGLYL